MTLLAIPNVSEGRDPEVIGALEEAVTVSGARILDKHVDAVHNRSVFTVTAGSSDLIDSMTALAVRAMESIDLTRHEGVHPRIGALDVCPFVPHDEPIDLAVESALAAAERMGEAGLPVFLYGAASPEGRALPEIRRELGKLAPDRGPREIAPRRGAICVGARGPLIAFNVNIDAPVTTARRIAEWVRDANGGPTGLRALGLEMTQGSQVSMNITDPVATSIEETFRVVEEVALGLDAKVTSTEIVGLVESRFLPSPDARVTRLLVEPGHSVESALAS